jgi:hypothetical protein
MGYANIHAVVANLCRRVEVLEKQVRPQAANDPGDPIDPGDPEKDPTHQPPPKPQDPPPDEPQPDPKERPQRIRVPKK